MDVEKVYIYGLSFSNVDLPYLYEIASKVDLRRTHWVVSCYSRSDYAKVMNFFNLIRLDKSLYSIVKLQDIQKLKQLDMFDPIIL